MQYTADQLTRIAEAWTGRGKDHTIVRRTPLDLVLQKSTEEPAEEGQEPMVTIEEVIVQHVLWRVTGTSERQDSETRLKTQQMVQQATHWLCIEAWLLVEMNLGDAL